ncbi:MAG TPA: DAK2 domain-containing protein [Gaiellaceae bacterium]|nr:DAK2 domain-containing protein [Gaiellaceae bacterium]
MPEVGQGSEGALTLARAALAALEASRQRIDDLNVYPVPDGDTGTNMAETTRAVVTALERGDGDIVRSALMGARGNSGVILSQIVRGAVEALPEGGVDTAALAKALRGASDAAYAAVRNPQEGTILTVAREVAEKAEELAAAGASRNEALEDLVAHGEAALARTQEQFDVLRQAGVVDAGAAGLVEIMRGIAAHVRGEPLPEVAPTAGPIPLEAVHLEPSRYRYCTAFFVEGEKVDPALLETELAELGDSLLVVGAPGAVKVHVHTDEPGRALALATAAGTLEEIDIKNMHVQTAERTHRLERETGTTGAVAVCLGAGNRRLFESLGAVCVEGGESTNPSTSDIIEAVESLSESEVVVLPNSKNVVMAAEQAAGASAKTVRVVPTRTLQAGLGALVAYEPRASADENAVEMEAAAAAVRAGAVARASRSATIGPLQVEQGQFLGLVEGEPVTAGPALDPVAREVVERLLGESADVLTILLGYDVEGADELVEGVRTAHPELEIEVHEGGQPHYPLLFGVE